MTTQFIAIHTGEQASGELVPTQYSVPLSHDGDWVGFLL